jgi:hypothetical protein
MRVFHLLWCAVVGHNWTAWMSAPRAELVEIRLCVHHQRKCRTYELRERGDL